MSQEMENVGANVIITRAPKAYPTYDSDGNIIKAGTKPDGWSITLEHNFPDTLDGMTEQYGETAIYNMAFSQLRIDFQGAVRRLAEAGKSDDEIKETMATWQPGQKLSLGSRDSLDKLESSWGNMTPEQQAQYKLRLEALLGR